MIEYFPDVEQNTDEWRELRLGLPTASRFAEIMMEGKEDEASKTRTDLLYDLAGERFTGEPVEDYTNRAMERGKEMEADARSFYEFTRQVTVTRMGFIKNTIPGTDVVIGCSPDGLIGKKKKALEIKTLKPRLLIRQYVKGDIMPQEHRAQVQGTMLVAELKSVDLMLFYRGMPRPVIFTVERDDAYIKQLSNEIEIFDHQLRRLVQKYLG